LEAALDALPYSAWRVLAARVNGHFRAITLRSEPKQQPPYRPLAEVMKAQQVVHTIEEGEGTLIGVRFPAAASSVNVAGWRFHFPGAERPRGGTSLGLPRGAGVVSLEEFSDRLTRSPPHAPAGSASADAIRAVERQR